MTARQRTMVITGLALAAALAGVWYWLFGFKFLGDESGIRVKNGGSVHVIADSEDFKWTLPLHYLTTGTVKATAVLRVTGFDCHGGPGTLSGVSTVTLQTSNNRSYTLEIKGDRMHVNVPWLLWKHSKKGESSTLKAELSYGNKAFIVNKVTADGIDESGKPAKLDCGATGETVDDEVELDTR